MNKFTVSAQHQEFASIHTLRNIGSPLLLLITSLPWADLLAGWADLLAGLPNHSHWP